MIDSILVFIECAPAIVDPRRTGRNTPCPQPRRPPRRFAPPSCTATSAAPRRGACGSRSASRAWPSGTSSTTSAAASNGRRSTWRSTRRAWCRRWSWTTARCSPNPSPSSSGWTRLSPRRRCCRPTRWRVPAFAPSPLCSPPTRTRCRTWACWPGSGRWAGRRTRCRPGPRTPTRRDWPRARPCSQMRRGRSALAMRRGWPTSASCRSLATPGASAWTCPASPAARRRGRLHGAARIRRRRAGPPTGRGVAPCPNPPASA